MLRVLLTTLLLTASAFAAPPLRWGGDAEGGAPFVEADPSDPSKLRGFDAEVAEETLPTKRRAAPHAGAGPA